MLAALAEAALGVLARDGATADRGGGQPVWRFDTETGGGMAFEIRCSGPDLPATIPDETILAANIPKDPKWRGAYRLTVAPPLLALDICWTPGEPLRIMTFSRGDWEDELLALAARRD